jgi:hypothetical protein
MRASQQSIAKKQSNRSRSFTPRGDFHDINGVKAATAADDQNADMRTKCCDSPPALSVAEEIFMLEAHGHEAVRAVTCSFTIYDYR